MSRYPNSKKEKFFAELPQESLDRDTDPLTTRCKFNFAYFVKQDAGQDFNEWGQAQLYKLLDKLKEYSKNSLSHWRQTPCKSGHILEIYGAFPKGKSDFTFPPSVPHQVEWGRFRLEAKVRLVGFVIPNDYVNRAHASTGMRFDCNTFYVVFLDANHRFYKTEKE